VSRVGSRDYSGKMLIEVNLSSCTEDEAIATIKEATTLIKSQARNSVLLFTDVSNTGYNKKVVDAIKDFAVSNTPYVKASAVVGIDEPKKPILATIRFLTLHEIKSFETIQEAKDWLVNFV
jgi:hypothetical protein